MRLFFACIVVLVSATVSAKVISIGEMLRSAKDGDTVEIEGTITCIGIYRVTLWDGTGGVVVYDFDGRPDVKEGKTIRISAVVSHEKGDMIVRMRQLAVVGENLEEAIPIPLTPAVIPVTRGLDFHSVSLSGVVIDAFRDELDPMWVFLVFAPSESHVAASIYDPDKTIPDPGRLVDSEMRVTGNYRFGSNTHQFSGHLVLVWKTSNIAITKPPPKDPFAQDKRLDVNNPSLSKDGHRRFLSGLVLSRWNENAFHMLTDGDRRVRVYVRKNCLLPNPGTCVMVSGFPIQNYFSLALVNALCIPISQNGAFDEPPADIDPHELLFDTDNQQRIRYSMDGKLIRFKGRVIATSSHSDRRHSFFLDCGEETIEAEVEGFSPPPVNSSIQVTGICRMKEEDSISGLTHLTGFAVLPRTAEDIIILDRPPWLTPRKTVFLFVSLCALLACGTIWNMSLRKLVARKGRELAQESLEHLKSELRVDERMALAVELHDTIAQNLTGVSMQLEGVDEAHRMGSPRLGELIGKARHALDSCCVELRNCLWDLRNDAFDSVDMCATVRKAIIPHLGNATSDVALDLPRSHISDSTFHALLCIVRELVINAVKHGKATHLDIFGEMTTQGLEISVKDNGCGFDPATRLGPDQGHFGLLGIQERLDRLGGTLNITSSAGKGATFTITIES